MIYICPVCTRHTLFEKSHIELPSDTSSEEFSFLALECASCHTFFLGCHSERHFPVDSIDSFAYKIKDESSFIRLAEFFASCTKDKNDNCPAHQKLTMMNTKNNWQMIDWKELSIFLDDKVYPFEVSPESGIPDYFPV